MQYYNWVTTGYGAAQKFGSVFGGIKIKATPTTNTSLPFRRGDFDTLVEALEYAAQGQTGYNFYSLKGELESRLPYTELRDAAVDLALRLIPEFPRNARLAIVSETLPDFHIFFFACQYAGLIPVPLPLPVSIGGKEGYVAQINRMIRDAGAAAVVASAELLPFMREATADLENIICAEFETFRALPTGDSSLRQFSKDEISYIQYSSGSTTSPKGIVCTQHAVTSNGRGIIVDGLDCRPSDRGVSWLPLYHDMGLVGFGLVPMLCQISVDYIATPDFARRPLLWLKILSDNGGSLAFSPSFGYDLCARRANGSADGYDLSNWRVAGIGGDMVRPDVLDRFGETFKGSGFQKNAFVPSYGLAESTLAVSFADLSSEFRTDTIDMRHYARSGTAQPVVDRTEPQHRRTFVSCGRVLTGHELEVRDANGGRLDDRQVGRIFVKGPSVARSYFHQVDATNGLLDDEGWLDTGDMGYMLDGETMITGRSKELILWNGRNIWPQDIEWAVEKLPEVRQGGVAAFSVQEASGDQVVVTVVECRLRNETARQDLEREITAAIHSTVGVPSRVTLVPPRSMIMTSSGKLSRAKVKEKYISGAFRQGIEPEESPILDVAISPG